MLSAGDWNGCRHTLKRYSLLIAATAFPIMFVTMAFSRPVIALLFQRGAFTSMDTDLVSRVQICYAVQIPFYICGMLFVRFLLAVRRTDLLLYGALANLALDIVLNVLLMKFWGVAGIALSTSLVYCFSFLFVAIWSIRILAKGQPLPRALEKHSKAAV
jgi:putative peptidoglycan lipid II flippase